MLSFIRCSLYCCHQIDGYCSVNVATSVVNSGDMGCIYYEPLINDKTHLHDKKQNLFDNPLDKDTKK